MKPRVFFPAILSGLLLWTAFFPLDLGFMAYIALAPFLALVRVEGIGASRRYFAAYVGGIVFFGLALNWIRVAHPMMAYFAWPGMTLYCALYWPIALWLVRRLDRTGLPLAITFPLVWVGLEYFRTHFPTGFPFLKYVHMYQLSGFGWYHLGYSQHRLQPMLQAADLGGVYLLSLAVAAMNGAVYEWAARSRFFRRVLRRPIVKKPADMLREAWITGGAVTLTFLLIAYGATRLAHPDFDKGPRIAAIQGNLPQDEKILRGDQKDGDKPAPVDREYLDLAWRASRPDNVSPAPDLVIWPETCFGYDWFDFTEGAIDDPQFLPSFKIRLFWEDLRRQLSTLTRTNMLIGLNGQVRVGNRWQKYNSALMLRPDGVYVGRYDKIHLVPFGEYVPFKEFFPWMKHFAPYEHDYSCTPGENWTRFPLEAKDGKTYHFGVLICYEDSDPYLARQYNQASGRGHDVDFLVNMSNDGWFDGTEEHEQHLAICRFRAVEARRSVVRAVNMGISAVIDPDGRIVALPVESSWAASKKTKGIVRMDVPIDYRPTIYAYVGDWVPGLCWLGIVGILGWHGWQRRSVPLPPVTDAR